jgi:Cdc6-like AAA superfamily ATPase
VQHKATIIGFKIIRGNRGTNKSVVAKGMLRNVNKYKKDEEEYIYPNYPYNDTKADAFN